MLFPKIKKKEQKKVVSEADVRQRLDEEILTRLNEVDDKDINSEAYTAAMKNMKVLGELRGVYGMTPPKQNNFPDQTVAKALGIAGTVLVTCFWVGVERNSVVPMRVINATDKLLKA